MRDVLRTSKCLKIYRKRRQNINLNTVDLTTLPLIKKWDHWVLVQNEFPYDKIADKHDLLVSIRKFADGSEMEDLELNELYDIKSELSKKYHCFIENTLSNRTVPKHFHIHCIKFKYITPIEKLS